MTAEIAQMDQTRCSGCGRCISACEFRLFSFETRAWKKTAVLHDIDRCNGCGECASRFVIGALIMVEKSIDRATGQKAERLIDQTSMKVAMVIQSIASK